MSIRGRRGIERGDHILTADPEMVEQLRDYADAPPSIEEGMIRRARLHFLNVDREETVERVGGIRSLALTRKEIDGAYESAVRWESVAKTACGVRPRSDPDLAREQYADQRNRMDRAA